MLVSSHSLQSGNWIGKSTGITIFYWDLLKKKDRQKTVATVLIMIVLLAWPHHDIDDGYEPQ
jgi:hypothetical protein